MKKIESVLIDIFRENEHRLSDVTLEVIVDEALYFIAGEFEGKLDHKDLKKVRDHVRKKMNDN